MAYSYNCKDYLSELIASCIPITENSRVLEVIQEQSTLSMQLAQFRRARFDVLRRSRDKSFSSDLIQKYGQNRVRYISKIRTSSRYDVIINCGVCSASLTAAEVSRHLAPNGSFFEHFMNANIVDTEIMSWICFGNEWIRLQTVLTSISSHIGLTYMRDPSHTFCIRQMRWCARS